MRVNSAQKSFFNTRLATVVIVTLATFFITSSFTKHPNRDLRAKEVNLMIRQIGHMLLLQAGDSTSRVLPVTEIKEGTFELRFENAFFFSHDSLITLSQQQLPKAQFPSGYTVTVHQCLNSNIVYGFQRNNRSPDIEPCVGRSEALDCYRIEIVFPDLYKNVEKEEKVKPKKADIGQPAEVSKAVKPGTQEVNPVSKELKTTALQSESLITSSPRQPDPLVKLLFSGVLVLLGVTLLIGQLGKILKPVAKDQDHAMLLRKPVPEFPSLGKFQFDVKDQRLLVGNEVISLTDKECRILELLNKNFGELIPREMLMQQVWINEGVITGRSLDMFVSKLRKKLSGDTRLRITNVHGKGYKLEIPGTQA